MAVSRPSPFSIRGIDHVVLRVRDPAAMLAFYRDVLGCVVAREQPELGLLQLRAGAALIDLVDVAGKLGRQGGAPPGSEGRNMEHLCLRVDPFDPAAIRAYLAAAGIAAEAPATRFGAEGFGPSMYLEDPEGNVIELKGPSSPSGRWPVSAAS